jgi:Uma2 family endonuclease
VEVDLSSDSLDKLEIYSSLGVPEIWRVKDGELRIHRLRSNGKYVERSRSSVFPELPLSVLRDFIARWDTAGETILLRELESWAEGVARKR